MLLSNVFSDMFDDMMYGMPRMAAPAQRHPGLMNCEVREFPERYELDLELAGFKKGDIKAELKDGYLTVKAERRQDHQDQDGQGKVIRSERFSGVCQRSFYIGEDIRREDISASFEDGVLKLAIPKKPALPKEEEIRTIEIQ